MGYESMNVFNGNKTALLLRTLSMKTLNTCGKKCTSSKNVKRKSSLVICMNTDGKIEQPIRDSEISMIQTFRQKFPSCTLAI